MSNGIEASVASVFVLRRSDQCSIAALTLAAALIVLTRWLAFGDWPGSELGGPPKPAISFQTDVNTAAWPELLLLPEIGENLAQRIVETRRDAAFRSLADFDRRVKGIGPLTIARISPYLLPLPDDFPREAPAPGKR